jgi:hypothetical protein
MEALADRRTTATALTRQALARGGIAGADGDRALRAAAESDRRHADGTHRYLEGLPVAVACLVACEPARRLDAHGAIAIGFGHGTVPAIARGAVAAGLATRASIAGPACGRAVVAFQATQDGHALLGRGVDDIILLAGALQLGAPWRDAAPRPVLGLLAMPRAVEAALGPLRRHFCCRPVAHGVRTLEAPTAFALGDDAGPPIDGLVLAAGSPCDTAGCPVISLPVAMPGAEPLRIIGRPGTDGELLQIAERIEQSLADARP